MFMKKILFVCTANIARSPMAAALFNQKMVERGREDFYRAESAGTWAVDGLPAPEDGKQVMRFRGLDTSSHRSRVVNKEIITSADLILTMEAGHKEALQIEFPDQKGKIWMLSEIVGQPYDIPDPYMQGRAKYEATAQELEQLLDQGIERICALADEVE